ncbi:hypothetical protein H4R20_002828 [Coemansia guatemalensis]|uniref:Uncharacterized protein n=1 Tax=Coemansia guatemalensis TaxID=2761395 RepID=A0A9W8LT78_9FUNG|nr:hypothetical protein H4R20_002828 [Coemansia guatemalensis]
MSAAMLRARTTRSAARAVRDPSFMWVRWKTVVPMSKVIPPEFDLEKSMADNPNVSVHNPLLAIERENRIRRERELEKVDKERKKFIPDIRGSHPPAIVVDYMESRAKFFASHEGILNTPTRMLKDNIPSEGKLNFKSAFGVVGIFVRSLKNVKELPEIARKFEGEFNFRRPGIPYTDYIAYFEHYIKALLTLSPKDRIPYLDDFYYLIKAIRQRTKVHGRVMMVPRFNQLVMSYFLLSGRNTQAMYASTMCVTQLIPEVIDRWSLAVLLENPNLTNPSDEQITSIQDVEEGRAPQTHDFDKEYRYNMVAHFILNYFYRMQTATMSDYEIFGLIRCTDARLLGSDLKDILPFMIRRLLEGRMKLNARDRVDLHYNPNIAEMHLDNLLLFTRYALALLRTIDLDACVKFLHTVASMPAQPCGAVPANTQDVANAIIKLSEVSSNASEVLTTVLRILSRNAFENSVSKRDLPELRHYLIAEIVNYMAKPESWKISEALTGLLSTLESSLQPSTAMKIILRLEQRDVPRALAWAAMNMHLFNYATKSSVVKWVSNVLAQHREKVAHFFLHYPTEYSAVSAAQFAHVLCRQLWECEADRRFVLSKALPPILQSKDMHAIGILLVTAALGPNTPVLSPFGPGSNSERMKAVSKILSRVKGESDDLKPLLSYLFKVAGSLEARETERALWTEVLRRGVKPDYRMLQVAILMRLTKGYAHNEAFELIEHTLEENPVVSEKSNETAEDVKKMLPSDTSALYLTILKALNQAGMVDAFEALAKYLLEDGGIDDRTFGALASTWIDAVGHSGAATSSDVKQLWDKLKEHVNKSQGSATAYTLNRNHYHSVIEAYVRLGEVEAAWEMILGDMHKAGLAPDLMTFYTLVSPLGNNAKMWAVGKSTVAKFNERFPGIVKQAVEDKSNTLVVKALLNQALDLSENPQSSS